MSIQKICLSFLVVLIASYQCPLKGQDIWGPSGIDGESAPPQQVTMTFADEGIVFVSRFGQINPPGLVFNNDIIGGFNNQLLFTGVGIYSIQLDFPSGAPTGVITQHMLIGETDNPTVVFNTSCGPIATNSITITANDLQNSIRHGEFGNDIQSIIVFYTYAGPTPTIDVVLTITYTPTP